MNPNKISEQVVAFMEKNNLKQRDLAKHTGIHQSQISRIINARFRTASKNVRRICEYANIDFNIAKTHAFKPEESPELMEAIGAVWDRTSTNAKALARVIKSLKGLYD